MAKWSFVNDWNRSFCNFQVSLRSFRANVQLSNYVCFFRLASFSKFSGSKLHFKCSKVSRFQNRLDSNRDSPYSGAFNRSIWFHLVRRANFYSYASIVPIRTSIRLCICVLEFHSKATMHIGMHATRFTKYPHVSSAARLFRASDSTYLDSPVRRRVNVANCPKALFASRFNAGHCMSRGKG